MPKCPNCGQAALRTRDWACQWCGYPLVSGSYREIPKTYKELKEEILHEEEPPVTEETEVTSQPDESTLLPTTMLEPEPEPAPEPEAEPEPEPQPVPKPKSKSKAKSKRKSKPGSRLKSKPENTEVET